MLIGFMASNWHKGTVIHCCHYSPVSVSMICDRGAMPSRHDAPPQSHSDGTAHMNKELTVFCARYGWAVSAALMVFAAAPYVVASQAQRGAITSAKADARNETARLNAGNESLAALSEVAAARIKRGCVEPILEGEPVGVRPGLQIRDGVSGHPVAPGMVFCDRFGNTAVSDATGTLVDFAPLNGSTPLEPAHEQAGGTLTDV